MTNRQMLKQIGLTDAELRDYLHKMNELYNSLTPAERRIFRAGRRSLKKAAVNSFHGRITAEELEEFIRSREPKDASIVFIVRKVSSAEDDDE